MVANSICKSECNKLILVVMKLKTGLLLVLGSFLFSNQLIAQTLSPVVISSSGGSSANGTAMLSATVGEMTMVETFSNAGVILTQGFQQPVDFGVSVDDIESLNGMISLGPNPTHGTVNLFFNNNAAFIIKINVIDMRGRIIYNNEIKKSADNNFVKMNFSALACGDYILEFNVTGKGNEVPKSFSRKITVVD